MAAEEPQEGSVIEEKLDAVVNLLQDLFILEATRVEMGQEPITTRSWAFECRESRHQEAY